MPAQAQDTLVSSLADVSGAVAALPRNARNAQTFRTGNAPGSYALSGVAVLFDDPISGYPSKDKCSGQIGSDASDGAPGSSLVTLTNPSTFVNEGENAFTVAGEVALAANTRYHVVVECKYDVFVEDARWARSSKVDAQNGWRIPGERHQQFGSGDWTTYKNADPYTIEIKGTEIEAPVVSVASATTPVMEGTDASFTVTRSGDTDPALTVSYRVSETGAMVAAGDEGDKTVSFASGDTEKTVTAPTQNDSSGEQASVVTLEVTADAAYAIGSPSSATVTVEDDDLSLTLPAEALYFAADRTSPPVTMPEATGGVPPYAYSLRRTSNRPLLLGVSFDPDTRVLSATVPDRAQWPSGGGARSLNVFCLQTSFVYSVTDGDGAKVEHRIDVEFADYDDGFLPSPGPQSFVLDTAIAPVTLDPAPDAWTYAYALTGPNGEDLSEAPGLSFDPATRTLSGARPRPAPGP